MKKEEKVRGAGCVYRRPGSAFWWMRYYKNGRGFCESTKQIDEKKALQVLRRKTASVLTGTFAGPRVERVRIHELAEGLLRDYKVNGRKSLDDVEARWRLHLKPFFGHQQAQQLNTDQINNYIDQRQEATDPRTGESTSNATINRELAALKRMYTWGQRSMPLLRRPYFPHVKENPPREGFLEDKAYTALAKACSTEGLWLRGMLDVGYEFGWRREDVQGLKVSRVNLVDGVIRKWSGETKNDEGRVAKMSPRLKVILQALIAGKKPDDFVFTRDDGKHVLDWRGAWWKVCAAAGVGKILCSGCSKESEGKLCRACGGRNKYEDLHFHDLRRTAIRNMVRAGIPEKTAMQIAGYKTRAIFDRYNIVAQQDLDDAARKLERFRKRTATFQLQSGARGVSKIPGQVDN